MIEGFCDFLTNEEKLEVCAFVRSPACLARCTMCGGVLVIEGFCDFLTNKEMLKCVRAGACVVFCGSAFCVRQTQTCSTTARLHARESERPVTTQTMVSIYRPCTPAKPGQRRCMTPHFRTVSEGARMGGWVGGARGPAGESTTARLHANASGR